MDEISLNIACRHCRSPLSGGENARALKSAVPKVSCLSREGNVACPAKEKMQRQMLGHDRPIGSASTHHRKSRSKRLFCGRIIPVSVAWNW
jgi:hypothetical protein